MSIFRMLLCPVALFFLLTPLTADEAAKNGTDRSNEAPKKGDTPPPPETVDLLDGADTAEGALRAFVAASRAADDEAALCMVDPPIRRLLIPEIAIERFAIDSIFIDHAIFGENKKRVPFMLFYFASRDLINLKSVEILETRVVDDERIVFTVYSTEGSYHGDGNTTTVQDILTVRRSGKWYVVRLFGMLTNYFRGDESDKSKRPILQGKNGTPDSPNRRDATFQLQFNVPIEHIHAELVRCAKSPEIAECLVLASRLERLLKSIDNQAKRGQFKTRGELEQALKHGNPWVEVLTLKIPLALEPALKELAKQQLKREAERKAQ